MNIEELKKQLIIDEGCRYEVYLDHLGYPTFGIGHLLTQRDIEWFAWKTISKEKPGMKISPERVNEVFEKDVKMVCRDCQKLFPDWENLPEEIKQIIANMMFNLGLTRLSKFKTFIKCILERNYKAASQSMKQSLWYKQVGNRAKRLVARMEKFANDSLCRV